MRLRRHIRVILSAELCSLWTAFGGIAAQFNHIAVLLSLATLESAGFATRYHALSVRTLADCARARFPFDYHAAPAEIREDTLRAITTDIARSVTTPQNEAQRRSKGKVRRKGTKNKGEAPNGNKGKQRPKSAGTEKWEGKVPAPLPVTPVPAAGNYTG